MRSKSPAANVPAPNVPAANSALASSRAANSPVAHIAAIAFRVLALPVLPVLLANGLSVLPLPAIAADSIGAAAAAVPVLTTLPSWQFASTVAADELYDTLKSTPTFAALDKEKLGSPVAIRVSHMFGHTSKGTASAIASALLAGGTLGILPAFSNRDLTVTYEVLVNGSVLLSYQYSKNLTRVFNLHSTDKTHGLGDEGVAWVTGTARQFAADVARDSKFAELQAEYRYYYAPASPDPAH